MLITWSSTSRFSNKHPPRKSQALHTTFAQKDLFTTTKTEPSTWLDLNVEARVGIKRKTSCNNKRVIIRVIYHFGFWMHRLDLGRSTGVAEIWTLHSQEVGVHWHLSLHLRQRKATESRGWGGCLGLRQSCIFLSNESCLVSLNNCGESLWFGEG